MLDRDKNNASLFYDQELATKFKEVCKANQRKQRDQFRYWVVTEFNKLVKDGLIKFFRESEKPQK